MFRPPQREAWPRRLARWLLSLYFLVGGSMHFAAAPAFVSVVPKSLPAPALLVAVSGACELGLGLALFVPRLRAFAGVGLFLLILAVWPANWSMALAPARFAHISPLLLWLRVALQLPMLGWALYAGNVGTAFNRARD